MVFRHSISMIIMILWWWLCKNLFVVVRWSATRNGPHFTLSQTIVSSVSSSIFLVEKTLGKCFTVHRRTAENTGTCPSTGTSWENYPFDPIYGKKSERSCNCIQHSMHDAQRRWIYSILPVKCGWVQLHILLATVSTTIYIFS